MKNLFVITGTNEVVETTLKGTNGTICNTTDSSAFRYSCDLGFKTIVLTNAKDAGDFIEYAKNKNYNVHFINVETK